MASLLVEHTPRRGRPRKFAQPSRAVTLTLPEHVLAALGGINRDLSRAVVRLAEAGPPVPQQAAELMAFGRRSVIVVTPTKTLEQRTGVVLVPVGDGRALICFDGSMTPARLELVIQDALDERDLPDDDCRVFQAIRDVLREARRSDSVNVQSYQIIVLEFGSGHKRAGQTKRARAARGNGS